MAGYQRKIAYLDYLENGMKIKNAGFVRIEGNGTQTRMELRVKNIPEMFHGQYELKADTDDVIGRISMNRGNGSCCVVWQGGAKLPEGKKFVQAGGIYIRLPGRHLLQAVWDSPIAVCVETGEKQEEPQVGRQRPQEREAFENAESRQEEATGRQAEKDRQEVTAGWQVPESRQEDEAGRPAGECLPESSQQPPSERLQEAAGLSREPQLQELIVQQRNIVPPAEKVPERTAEEREEKGREEAVCFGDKWEQLIHMYPVIHPFGDAREYLSIAPKDFVVLRQEYQKMVHNSFLLHGYYNYKHVILGRMKRDGQWCYYLGVPGNFYGREKMVAEMFGFEAFESEKEPVHAGDFGYFMKQVEI